MEKNVRKELGELIIRNSRKNINFEDINDNTLLIDDLGYDSINLVELLVQIEDAFNIEFLGTEIIVDNINCFGMLVNFINKQLEV